jgi:hypothetical protein
MYCLQCNKFTTNDKFCSRSCAASYNNKVKPKRIRKPSNCKTCNKPIQSRRSYCLDCNPFYVDWAKITFGDVISRRRYQAHSRIRDLATKHVSIFQSREDTEINRHTLSF